MTVKIEDVARRARVSIATVSRVLANKPHVSARTRQRVLTAVEELAYRPSRVARSLRSQHSKVIGLIISDIQNPFFTSIVRAVEDVAYAHEYVLLLCNADEDPDKEALYIDLMIAEQAAGIILSPTIGDSPACQRLLSAQIPVVAIDRRLTSASVDTVVVDNIAASYEVVSHLLELGHRRIGAVIGVSTASTSTERRDGYLNALQDYNVSRMPDLLRQGSPKVANGYAMTKDLLTLPEPPTALFTGNNLLTIGALRAIHEQDLTIPDDIALAAFDEMDWMFVMNPPLTVVAQPTYEMGQQAANLLLDRIETPDRPVTEVMLQPTVRVRASSA